ncbi:MAG: phenylalanine--tRNA ligase subunit alpha [Actinomycetes bacterium]|jgi:phenylalanyl-tRNA synthetase alpha chain
MSSTPPDQQAALDAAVADALARISAAPDAPAIRAAVNAATGKKGPLAAVKSGLGKVADLEARKALGQAVNEAIARVEQAAAERESVVKRAAFAGAVEADRVDMSELALRAGTRRGRMHLVTQATERLEDVFVGLGFRIAEGPEVETDFHNFEALNMPPSHPARSMWDTLFVDQDPQGSVVLRTHTSPVQIRVMQEWPPPIYAVMPGRVFRKETPDATHMPVFHQIEGLVVDRNITFADLAGTIESFTKAFFGEGFTSRLRPSYFPFTEPSAEFDIRRPDGSWIELGGCGMVHPRVLAAAGLDPEEWSGFAFGFGIDRMAKERHGVEDIREMYSNDVRFTEQFS